MCHLDCRAEDIWSPARSTWKDEYLGLLMGLRAAGKYRPTGSSSLRLSAPETEARLRYYYLSRDSSMEFTHPDFLRLRCRKRIGFRIL